MNRIIVGSSNNKIGIVKKDEIIFNIKNDTNILIENSDKYNFIFNVSDAKVNILDVRERIGDSTYEINIKKAYVSFNTVSYLSGNIKMNINLDKEDSKIDVYNSVIAKNKVTYNIKVNHNAKNTNSNINNNGVTKEDGTLKFNVSSYVAKNNKGCIVNQDSKIITLNETNENEINPILLIDEYECEARHGAFIGNFNGNELFYLMSRGLNKKEAMNLLINGLLIGTLDVCFNEKEDLKKKLNDEWR